MIIIYGLSVDTNIITVYLLNDNVTMYNRITKDDEWVLLYYLFSNDYYKYG